MSVDSEGSVAFYNSCFTSNQVNNSIVSVQNSSQSIVNENSYSAGNFGLDLSCQGIVQQSTNATCPLGVPCNTTCNTFDSETCLARRSENFVSSIPSMVLVKSQR